MFDVVSITNKCIKWIQDWFNKNGKDCKCIIGISGGKDSSVVAALCVQALGKDRVFGVLMPNGLQTDIDCSYLLCKHLDIEFCLIPIGHTINTLKYDILGAFNSNDSLSNQAEINLPARIRMSTLYAVSQSMNGRVANTCNLSEDWVGYSTIYGDDAGDF